MCAQNNAEVVSELLEKNGGVSCINVPNTTLVEEIEQYYQQQFLPTSIESISEPTTSYPLQTS